MLSAVKKGIQSEDSQLGIQKRSFQFLEVINRAVILDVMQDVYSLEEGIVAISKLLANCRKNQNMTYVIGNGGSSAIAGHAVIDLMNMGKIKAIALHEAATITCLSNDYGYEEVYSKQLKKLARSQDILIAISSSGKSPNILNAVDAARANNAIIITMSGFSSDNPLKKKGDINLWLDSNDYGFVEIGHAFILHNITDRLNMNEEFQ